MLQIFLNWLENFNKWPDLLKVNQLPVKGLVVFLCPVLVPGCMSVPIKLTDSARVQMKVVQVVALEAPPLEIVPDLLETRMPIYEYYDNMALPLYTKRKVFRYPGGLLIAGHVGDEDSVEIIDLTKNSPVGNEPKDWLPTKILIQELIDQLHEAGIQTFKEKKLLRLPMKAVERDANLTRWRDSVEHWYETEIDGRSVYPENVDAVVELGIGQYRIFAGQITLQILIKLVDPESGRVMARVAEKSTDYEAPIEQLLKRDGAKFKSLIRQRASRLIARGLRYIGLASN